MKSDQIICPKCGEEAPQYTYKTLSLGKEYTARSMLCACGYYEQEICDT